MALTNRERMIVIFAAAAVLILLADSYVLSPILEKREETRQTLEKLTAEKEKSEAALNRQKLLQEQWDQMLSTGLSYQYEIAEGMLYRQLQDSSQRANLLLTAIQPDRPNIYEQHGEVEFMISGTGNMAAVTQFLWQIETSSMPLKIKSLQVGSNNDNATQMSIQLKLSSIYLIKPQTEKDTES